MQWSVKQVYRAAWRDLKGNTNAWVMLALLLVVPVWLIVGVEDLLVRGIGDLLSLVSWMIAVKISLHIVDGHTPVLESIVPSIGAYMKILAAFFLLALPFAVLGGIAAVLLAVLEGVTAVLLVVTVIAAVAVFIATVLVMMLLYYVMLDTGSGIIQAISQTFLLVKKRPLMLAWFVAMSAVINMAGFFLLTLGLLVTLPLSLIAGARVYRALNTHEVDINETAAVPVVS